MAKNNDKALDRENSNPEIIQEKEFIYSNTDEVKTISFDVDIPQMYAFLEITDFEEKGRRIELREDKIIIGRSPRCEITFPVKHISREHACIYFHNEEYFIEDLDSTNGIYINGVKIAKCALRNQDQIELGKIKMTFIEYLENL